MLSPTALRDPHPEELPYLRGIVYSQATVDARALTVADELRERVGTVDLMLSVLAGGIRWSDALAPRLDVGERIDCGVSFYHKPDFSLSSDGTLEQLDPGGKRVLIVDDVLGTGRTVNYVVGELQRRRAAAIALCTLVDNPSIRSARFRHLASLEHVVGFTVARGEFVCGYGIRGLPPAPSSLRDLRHIYRTGAPTSLTHPRGEDEPKEACVP